MYKVIHKMGKFLRSGAARRLAGTFLKKQEHCSNFRTSLIESALARSFPLEHCPTHANIQEHC